MTNETEENEASVFAMELLMPTDMLKQDFEKRGIPDIADDATIHHYAKRYRVPEGIMAIRLAEVVRAL